MITKLKEKPDPKSKNNEVKHNPNELLKINTEIVVSMLSVASKLLESSRDYLNKINVFPVADGDTGSNMSFTLKAVASVIKNKSFTSVDELFDLASATIVSKSRGNSGTILAGFVSGFLQDLKSKSDIQAVDLAAAIAKGFAKSKDSVTEPKKGTILDVFESFSQEFSKLSLTHTDIFSIWEEALKAAKISLEKTRTILPESKKAHVVDAGAAGGYVVLDGFKQGLSITGNHDQHVLDENDLGDTSKLEQEIQDLKYQYCTEILFENNLSNQLELKDMLKSFGDSIQVISNGSVIKVHIHTNEPEMVRLFILDRANIQDFKVDDMAKMQSDWIKSRHENTSESDSVVDTNQKPRSNKRKEKLLIITDTSADLPFGFEQNFPVWKLEIPVYTDDDPELNWQSRLSREDFYQKMVDEPDFIPQTSMVNPETFHKAFQDALEFAENVLVLPMSSGISNTFKSAIKAKENFQTDRIRVLDSQTSSAGLGLKIKYIFDKLQAGTDLETIVNSLIHLRSKIKVFFSVDDVKYLQKKGRIKPHQGLLAKWFNISPLLMLKDGKIQNSGDKVFLSNNNKVASLLHEKLHNHSKNQELKDVFIVYAGVEGLTKANLLRDKLIQSTGFEIDINQIIPLSPVVGSHVGPGSIGLIFH